MSTDPDQVTTSEFFGFERGGELALPLVTASVAAGFPSPAEDSIDQKLDLNELLIRHPAATFFVRVQGDSMTGAGIHSGDILVVDRAVAPENNMVVVAALAGEFTVKRIRKTHDGRILLVPENPKFKPIEVGEGSDCTVWGVATSVIHSLAP